MNNNTNNNPLTPALNKLIHACLYLKTTDAKVIAQHLNKSPSTIRTEFQRTMDLLDVHCRYAAIKTVEEQGWLFSEND
ncbi:MAG: DNA-binding response regulator [Pseudomonadota bacterium]